jgi:hypothetical protein
MFPLPPFKKNPILFGPGSNSMYTNQGKKQEKRAATKNASNLGQGGIYLRFHV